MFSPQTPCGLGVLIIVFAPILSFGIGGLSLRGLPAFLVAGLPYRPWQSDSDGVYRSHPERAQRVEWVSFFVIPACR